MSSVTLLKLHSGLNVNHQIKVLTRDSFNSKFKQAIAYSNLYGQEVAIPIKTQVLPIIPFLPLMLQRNDAFLRFLKSVTLELHSGLNVNHQIKVLTRDSFNTKFKLVIAYSNLYGQEVTTPIKTQVLPIIPFFPLMLQRNDAFLRFLKRVLHI